MSRVQTPAPTYNNNACPCQLRYAHGNKDNDIFEGIFFVHQATNSMSTYSPSKPLVYLSMVYYVCKWLYKNPVWIK